MVMKLFTPSVEMPPLAVQPPGTARLEFCCNVQPVEGYGYETVTLLPECVMVKVDAPGVCTTEMRLQKPPVSE